MNVLMECVKIISNQDQWQITELNFLLNLDNNLEEFIRPHPSQFSSKNSINAKCFHKFLSNVIFETRMIKSLKWALFLLRVLGWKERLHWDFSQKLLLHNVVLLKSLDQIFSCHDK